MREILFISGKGGTGKTSLASSFILLADNCIACDYDVDASNLPILLQPQEVNGFDFSAGYTAQIDLESCTECGLCRELCRFDAIDEGYRVLPLSCEGCGFCQKICPVEAITMSARPSGRWYEGVFTSGRTGRPTFYAELRPGEENSGKLVTQVKTMARRMANNDEVPLIIADGPPGIGCAVIASMVGIDLAVVVAEPSLSGFHDLKRLNDLMQLRGIKGVLIINKWDFNPDVCSKMEAWASDNGMPLVGKIPFSTVVADSIAQAQIPAQNAEIRQMLLPIWENVVARIPTKTG